MHPESISRDMSVQQLGQLSGRDQDKGLWYYDRDCWSFWKRKQVAWQSMYEDKINLASFRFLTRCTRRTSFPYL